MAHPYNGIQPNSIKNEQNLYTCNTMGESWNHSFKMKKPDTKSTYLLFHLYEVKTKSEMIKIRNWFPLGTRKLILKVYKSNFWDVLYLCWLHMHVQLSIIFEMNTKDLCTLLNINYSQSKIRKTWVAKLRNTLVPQATFNSASEKEKVTPLSNSSPLPNSSTDHYLPIQQYIGAQRRWAGPGKSSKI